MIRFCPNCETERPLGETFCEGIINEVRCNWDLSTLPIREPGWRPESSGPRESLLDTQQCPNGHAIANGDIICVICGADIAHGAISATPSNNLQPPNLPEDSYPVEETVIDGWRLGRRLPASSTVRERFIATHVRDSCQAVLTLYSQGSEPDPSVYDVLRGLPRDHIPEIIATGRWHDRAYEVAEELTGGTLAESCPDVSDLGEVQRIVEEIGRALHAFAQVGLRHRDVRPGTILVRDRDPLDLVLIGYGSARLSDFDLDIVSPLETTRYTAPEAIAGGVAAASDWWSLGMVLLEQVTQGACFDGVHEQAFLIHVLANGVSLPRDLDPSVDVLLRGLLARDRRERWQWEEVRAWLAGETVAAPTVVGDDSETTGSATISLAGKKYHKASAYALAAAQASGWDEARDHLLRGAVAAWVEDAKLNPKIQAAIRQLAHIEGLTDDLRLSLSLKVLHPAMPLVIRGDIVTPGWLLDHITEGYELITGPAPEFLSRLDAESWIARLKARAEAVRVRARQLEIELNEEELRIYLLSTSKARLVALWDARRRLIPDTNHPGLVSLIERRQTTEEDLILLLGASTGQFRSIGEIADEAEETATRANIMAFSRCSAEELLSNPRRDLYRLIDERLEGFARCGNSKVDEWADQFRLERRMPIARVLALLAVPQEDWRRPPKQAYVSTILDYFAKKVSGAVLRGPLTRMVIGKWTPRVDLAELGSERRPASAILQQLLARTDQSIDIDPAVFLGPETLERRLRSLYTHATLYRRDTGIDGLYLGFPFLLMQDPRGNTRTRIAPVLLWPMRINPEVGNRGHVSIGFDRDRDEVRLNPAFEGLIGIEASRRWRDVAHELLGRASITTGDVMDSFAALANPRARSFTRLPSREVVLEPYQSEIACAAVFFHLAYMGQAIVEDLRQLKSIPPINTGLENLLRVSTNTASFTEKPIVPEVDRYFTVASDPSQEAAVLEARAAPGLLIEGPPGTGKSQTIVNMIGDAVGRGKNLLIVCQKQAALDVVRKRLDAEGLEGRFVMVADMNRDREAIVRSVREQLESLFSRPADEAPAWRRQREALAARIEALEGGLDQHHSALHRVDETTGLSYRTLLGELVAIEAGPRPPIDAPELRMQLSALHPGDVATLEESCGPLAKYWLPAKFEDSALAALKSFNPDDFTFRNFAVDFEAFVKAEAVRERINAETDDAIAFDDPRPYRDWFEQHTELFRSMDDSLRYDLARWISLFRSLGSQECQGITIMNGLNSLAQELSNLDRMSGDPSWSSLCAALVEIDLRQMIFLASAVLAPRSFLGRLNPKRWLRRKKLQKFLVSRGIEPSVPHIRTFLSAAQLEWNLRPLRDRLKSSLSILDGAPEVPSDLALTEINRLVAHHRRALAKVHEIVCIVDDYPHVVDAEAVARAGTCAAFEMLLGRAERGFSRCEARQGSLASLDKLSQWFEAPWVADRSEAIKQNASNRHALSAIGAALPTVTAYQRYRIRAARLDDIEQTIFRILRSKEAALTAIPPEELESEVRRTLAREARLSWKLRIEASEPTLLYESAELRSKINALAKVDCDMRSLNQKLLIEGINRAQVRPPREWEDITRLRGQRARRLREFIDHGADLGLMALRPVWLMNPDIASRVLPLKSGMFDVIIYDEASQMPIEYALPTLFRGRVVIVSGDEKQMPPTTFFSSKVENDEAALFDGEEPEDAASEEERDAFTETWNRREIKDCPDLLQLARTVLPTTTLKIHYRSAYRELIAFSNASFYSNRLSVPVRHPDAEIRRVRPIDLIRIDGIYRDQTNTAEADEVVDVLADFWKAPVARRPSIGVVTFNRKQADLIEEVLEDRAEHDPIFRDALSQERERIEFGEDISFFVKNVENVQGDERDVVIFSSTFGRNTQGTFRRNFGVLGQTGGERRLNVAVTRARQKVVMITSMPIAEISDLLTTRRPPSTPRDYLQAYFEYARTMSSGEFDNGRSLLARLVTERTAERDFMPANIDGFGRSVEMFLRDLGWLPVPALDSGAFGFDFAIEDPRTGLYGIGIECDAPRHPILKTARAREIWRPSVLSRAVPHIHRVSSYGWFHAGDAERLLLKDTVERALGSVRRRNNERPEGCANRDARGNHGDMRGASIETRQRDRGMDAGRSPQQHDGPS